MKHWRPRAAATPIALFACATGCATVAVSTDYDRSLDFGRYRTFAWLEEKQPLTGDVRLDNSLLHTRLREAVDEVLAAAGFEKTSSGKPDFRVGYHLSVEQRIDVSTLESHYGYGPGWNRVGYGPPTTVVTEYEQGTLLIDVVDTSEDRLVWRGSAEGRVRESATPEEREARMREVVASVLADFPPAPGNREGE